MNQIESLGREDEGLRKGKGGRANKVWFEEWFSAERNHTLYSLVNRIGQICSVGLESKNNGRPQAKALRTDANVKQRLEDL